MNYPDYFAYLQTDHWREMRRLALEHAEGRCQLCYSPDSLEVHHRTYERIKRERLTDLIVLCVDCHSWHHGRSRDRHHIKARGEGITEPSLIVPIVRYEAMDMAAEALDAVLRYGGVGDLRELLEEVLTDIPKTPGVLPYRGL